MDALGYLFCRGRLFDTLEADTGQYNDDVEVFWASGGCLMVRAAAYHAAGGLDADLYAHMEEVDLCWRLQRMGYRIGAIGSSTVFHVGGSVISYGSPQKLYYNFRNNLLLLLKNERRSRLLWLLPVRLVLDGVAGLKYLLGGQFKEVGVILRAHLGFYRMAGATWRKRKAFEAILTQDQLPNGRYTGAVIWQYFVKRIRTFSGLSFRPRPLSKSPG